MRLKIYKKVTSISKVIEKLKNNVERSKHKKRTHIKIKNIYFDLSPSQSLDIITIFYKIMLKY